MLRLLLDIFRRRAEIDKFAYACNEILSQDKAKSEDELLEFFCNEWI